MTERLVRGARLKGYMNFVKKRWGADRYQEVAKYAGVSQLPKDGDWVPLKYATKILEWIRIKKESSI